MFLALGAFSLWIAIRDWPLRRHHLAGAATGLLAAVVQLTEPAQGKPDFALAVGLLLLGIAAMLSGFADHRLLLTTVRMSASGHAAGVGEHRAA